MSIFIKNVEIKNNVILAPMAGFTDLAFRKMCLEHGAGLVCTEMVSAQALHYKNEKTESLLWSLDGEVPKAVQIFGHDPKVMAEAVQNPLLQKFDIIDINMGCPAPKIVRNGDGSALMKNPELAEEIIKACVAATDKPITVKFRIGYNSSSINAVDFAKMCERAGAAAITVHGRTTAQGYSGEVNLDIIRQVKDSVSIPVFANGDCRSKADFEKIIKVTKADGVAIGRAAVGSPEIFSQILGEEKEIDKLAQIKFHYETLLKFYKEIYVIKSMRAHLGGYLKGKYKNTVALVKLMKMEKYAEIIEFLGNFAK